MPGLHIVCVGTLKETYWKDACAEYIKRLTRFANVSITEISESRLPQNPSAAQIKNAVSNEGNALAASLKKGEYAIALDRNGKNHNSENFALSIEALMSQGYGNFAFIIGGSHGLSAELLNRADYIMSFSQLTFPHQMFRVMLLEQLYRAFKLNKGESYHK